MRSLLRSAAVGGLLCIVFAPLALEAAWGQAQGSRPSTPPPIVQPPPQPARPPVAAKPAQPVPVARPKPVPLKPAPAPIVRPAPRPTPPPATAPVVRPLPQTPPATTPVAQPRPAPAVPAAPVIAPSPTGPSPVVGCTRPRQPAIPSQTVGFTVNQMDVVRTDAVSYFSAADNYRACLDRFIEAERDKMFKNNTAETPELKRAAYEHSGFSEEKGKVYEAFTLFCYGWQSTNMREYPSGCQLPWNPGG
jgi:hypothetical protein